VPIQILFAYGMRFAGYPRARRDFSRLRVRAALRAAWDRLEALRRLEDFRAWDDNARCEAPLFPSFLKAPKVARERLFDGRRRFGLDRALSFFADGVPLGGGGRFTPAFRAFESPMAIACFGLRTPCFPSRT
jgi:hypothetical protein